jgi:hypothetical protein
MKLQLEEPGNPETRFEIGDEQIRSFRQTLLDEYNASNPEGEKITRRNQLILAVEVAVDALDAAGFEWGQQLDALQKKWAVRWMAWSLTARKHREQIEASTFVFIS